MEEDKLGLLKSLGGKPGNTATHAPASRLWLWVAASIAVCALGFFWWQRHSDTPPPHPQAQTATETPVSVATTRGSLVASGYVVARRIATVSAEITGTVREILVEEGMAVQQNQILARLDATLQQTERNLAAAKLASAEANVRSLAAQLAEAKRVEARAKKLQVSGYTSEASLTDAQAAATSLAAQLEQAKSDVEAARIEVQRHDNLLEKHVLRAPFAGVVIDKNAQPGEIISPMSAGGGFTRTGICTVVDMDSLEIEVDVNEANIARIRQGQEATAILDAYPTWRIPAEVIAIVPTANRDKATIRVRVGFKEKDERILPEMAVKVEFSGK